MGQYELIVFFFFWCVYQDSKGNGDDKMVLSTRTKAQSWRTGVVARNLEAV